MSEILITMNEDGVFEEYKPYKTIGFETKEDYEFFNKIIEEWHHYKDLEERLEKLFGGKLPLEKVVDNLKRVAQNGEEKLEYARILTNAEAEKWDKWINLEEHGRLIEVKHGRWVNERITKGGFREEWGYDCSECGATYNYKTNYCPNCGAKMELKGE